MKNEMMSKIMKRAWEIKKEDINNVFGLCLKMAWEETKAPKKEVFTGYAEIVDPAIRIWDGIISFSLWEKYGKKRIYINDQRRNSIGYIDLIDNSIHGDTASKYFNMAVDKFYNMYEVA